MLVVRLGMPAIVRWHSRFAPPHSQSLFLERCYSCLCVLAFSLGSLASDSTQRRKGERDAKRIIIFWNLGSKTTNRMKQKKENEPGGRFPCRVRSGGGVLSRSPAFGADAARVFRCPLSVSACPRLSAGASLRCSAQQFATTTTRR